MSNYSIWVKAYTWQHEGPSSSPLFAHTDAGPPRAPVPKLLCGGRGSSLTIHWRNSDISATIYYIHHWREATDLEIQQGADKRQDRGDVAVEAAPDMEEQVVS